MQETMKTSTKTRRSNGEGSLYQRKDGSWVYQITIENEFGLSERNTFTARAQADVVKKQKLFLRDYKKQQKEKRTTQSSPQPNAPCCAPEFRNITLVQWVEDYIDLYKLPPITKRTTYSTYKRYCRSHLTRFFGNTLLTTITEQHIQLFYNYLSSGKGRLDEKGSLSAKTIQNIHLLLKESLDKCVGKVFDKNPAKETSRAPVPEAEIRILTAQEMSVFIKEIFSERLRCAMLISLFTGVRMGELLALTWTDVNVDNRCIHVSKNITRIELFDDPGKKPH